VTSDDVSFSDVPSVVEPGLLRTTARLSVITAVARGLGFARWVVFGLTVGTTYLGNTYQTANWVPNILFELVAGGVVAWVFVPTFVTELERGRARADAVASSLMNLLLLISVPIVVLGSLFAPRVMSLFFAGVPDAQIRAREIELGATFLRYFLPQVPMYLVGMVARGLLNAAGRLTMPVLAPAFASACMIASYAAFAALGPHADVFGVSDTQVLVLALGATVGVFAWCVAQLVAVLRTGFRWRAVLDVRDPSVSGALRASVHGMGLYAVMQVGLLITLILANRVEGGVVAFYLAFAFYELPNALVGFPLSMVAVPSLARSALADDAHAFASLLSRTWRTASVVITPAAAGLAITAPAVARVLFERGPGRDASAELVSACLIGLAPGLPAFALSQGVVRTLYARRDTAAPIAFNGLWVLTYGIVAGVATLVADPTGTAAMVVIGAGHAAGQWVGLAGGVAVLRRRAASWTVAGDLAYLGRSILRAGVMAAAAYGAARLGARVGDVTSLVCAVGTGIVVYGVLVLRSREDREALGLGVRR
jgi:putative peptidoglycan lipid II flippase